MDMSPSSSALLKRRRAARTILIVDDSRTNLNIIAHKLGRLGYLIVLADSGAQALELISGRYFDMVLLDRVMPDLTGLHVLREIRSARDTADLPVILLTAQGDQSGAVEAFSAGADDFLCQPFDIAVLAARMERVLLRADRINELKQSNLALDARIAARAIELGEARAELHGLMQDRKRLEALIAGDAAADRVSEKN